jgi:hypothetical protein
MESGTEARLRWRMILKAADAREFVAYALALCARARGRTLVDLCGSLSCDGRGLLFRLALCRRPREDGDAFRPDLERIAAFAGVDPRALAGLLREASTFEASR